ncbi:hypothetical protein G7Y41_06910 [Schaalia sp. ZJ405]|uniref:hypothetical protein n=1 Tax=Schaalia sp. ZJ405 TaxID=2709403 RepID=UPI0013EC6292|nr:hypothetical protein [Schaalia sp. ZJ405]QPK80785.1 hypothetical protein G7Y41_06910 [Schaalia sp. ZJ405]
MSSKFDVRGIVKDHVAATLQTNEGKTSIGNAACLYGIPLLSAVASGIWLTSVPGELLTVISILAGLSFALAVFVFELRITAEQKFKRESYVLTLIDRLYKNVLYSVLIGILSVVLGVLVPGSSGTVMSRLFVGLCVGVSCHYVLVLVVVLRTLQAAYREMAIG